MTTNFEKWKKELTPELVQDAFDGFLNGEPCRHCPIDSICKGGLYGYDCMNPILIWANTETEEATR